jgi:hypothetical protein
LNLAAVAVDVHPPRASRGARRIRRWLPRHRFFRARDLLSESLEGLSARFRLVYRVPLPAPRVACRLIVPGWAHIHCGFGLGGWAYLGVYALLLGLGLLNWGNTLGAIMLGFAFSVHVSSVIDILARQGTVDYPSMLTTSALVSAILALGVYTPAGWILLQVAATRQFDYDAPPFHRFDVVLFNRWAFAARSPRAGDVVLVQAGTDRIFPAGLAIRQIRQLFLENECVDRVLGVPGDHVHWKDGKLSINGVAVSWKPLVPARCPAEVELTVPSARYLILPSTSRVEIAGVPSSDWEWLGCRSAEEILGRVYLRLNPLSRFWFIR